MVPGKLTLIDHARQMSRELGKACAERKSQFPDAVKHLLQLLPEIQPADAMVDKKRLTGDLV